MRRENRSALLILAAASVVVVVAGLRSAANIAGPLLVALFVAVLSLPLLFWLQTKGMPRPVAALMTVFAAAGVLVGAGFLVATAVGEFARQLPAYRDGLAQATAEAVEWLRMRGLEVRIADILDPEAVIGLAQGTMGRLAALVQDIFVMLLFVVFILFEAAYFPSKLRAAMGQARVERLMQASREVQRYLVIKTMVSLSVGVLAGTWIAAAGIDYPIFWGLVAFLMHYIPNIGAFLASIPPVLLALLELGGGRALLVALGYVVIHLVVGQLLEPRLMRGHSGLSTLVVFVSLVFWGWVWGPVGMLLSVPLTMIVKIMLENSEDWRWLAVLLGPGAPLEERPAR